MSLLNQDEYLNMLHGFSIDGLKVEYKFLHFVLNSSCVVDSSMIDMLNDMLDMVLRECTCRLFALSDSQVSDV